MQYEKYGYPVIDIEKTGKKIELFMRRTNVSAKQLQEYLGLSCVQSVYRWIDGNNLPSVDHLYAMSRLFRVSIDEIICGSRTTWKQALSDRRYRRFMAYYQIFRGHYAA